MTAERWQFGPICIGTPFKLLGLQPNYLNLMAHSDQQNYASINAYDLETGPFVTASLILNGCRYEQRFNGDVLPTIQEAINWINLQTVRLTSPATKWLADLSDEDRKAVMEWVDNGGDAPECIVKRAEDLFIESGKMGGLDDDLPDLIDGIATQLELVRA